MSIVIHMLIHSHGQRKNRNAGTAFSLHSS